MIAYIKIEMWQCGGSQWLACEVGRSSRYPVSASRSGVALEPEALSFVGFDEIIDHGRLE